eukprot:m.382793 g.382793  ORF g.382793 m.382793 type:complete len:186 (+) comp16724_c1_seq9:540-1097(+)
MGCKPSKHTEKYDAATEPQYMPDDLPPMEIALLDFLAGHVLRTALLLFEAAMGPWVKATMQQHFPDDPINVAEAAALEKQRCDLSRLQSELSAQRKTLQSQLKTASSVDRGDLHKQIRRVESEWRGIKQQLATLPAPPIPTWIEECHKGIGRAMKPFVTADARWDAHVIVSVMRAHLRDIFSLEL